MDRVEEAILELRVPKTNAGAASFTRNQHDSDCEVVDVPVKRLDDIVDHEEITSTRLLKIDVEGFEHFVFQGASRYLSNAPPAVILFEMNEITKGPLCEQPVFSLLHSYEYRFFSIPKCMFSVQLRPFDPHVYDASVSKAPVGHDFVAIKQGSEFENICKALKITQP